MYVKSDNLLCKERVCYSSAHLHIIIIILSVFERATTTTTTMTTKNPFHWCNIFPFLYLLPQYLCIYYHFDSFNCYFTQPNVCITYSNFHNIHEPPLCQWIYIHRMVKKKRKNVNVTHRRGKNFNFFISIVK